VRAKSGPLDLVTDADEAAERVITAGLQARFPGCVVVGEEATAADPSVLGRLAGADLAFVVDPVDGTANFAAGLPVFGCMAAAIIRGEIVASGSMTRSATTPPWRCAGRAPGSRRRTGTGRAPGRGAGAGRANGRRGLMGLHARAAEEPRRVAPAAFGGGGEFPLRRA
jgi:hypothetical protein